MYPAVVIGRDPFDQKIWFEFPKFSHVEWNGIFHLNEPISFLKQVIDIVETCCNSYIVPIETVSLFSHFHKTQVHKQGIFTTGGNSYAKKFVHFCNRIAQVIQL